MRSSASNGGPPPTAILADGVSKTFRIPTHRVESLKERVLHPTAHGGHRELQALRDVSFEVLPGEFFGIVGRNGSGKSTLLKILASIYAHDSGRIEITGSLAPFIELGVGFNYEMTARENVVLNGVMMGLRRREVERRLDPVLEFAELEDFADLKLKNYSSGMLVRLAFAVMMQSDAGILLIDEVLAVGDAGFQRKCKKAFEEMRDAGRTVVLVSHDMSAVEQFCDRAMLIEHGRMSAIGPPDRIAHLYTRLNLEPDPDDEASGAIAGEACMRVADAWLEAGGERDPAGVEQRVEVSVHAELEGLGEGIERPIFAWLAKDSAGTEVFAVGAVLLDDEGELDSLAGGERVRLRGAFDNLLVPGIYTLELRAMRNADVHDVVYIAPEVLELTVTGPPPQVGLVALDRGTEAVKLRPAKAKGG